MPNASLTTAQKQFITQRARRCCEYCLSQADFSPDPFATVPLYHPRQYQWSNHFVWSEDFVHMIGTTPIGRATIKRLDLNRLGVVNLRELLALAHRHPPF